MNRILFVYGLFASAVISLLFSHDFSTALVFIVFATLFTLISSLTSPNLS